MPIRRLVSVELEVLSQVQQTQSLDMSPETADGLDHVRPYLRSERDKLSFNLNST